MINEKVFGGPTLWSIRRDIDASRLSGVSAADGLEARVHERTNIINPVDTIVYFWFVANTVYRRIGNHPCQSRLKEF